MMVYRHGDVVLALVGDQSVHFTKRLRSERGDGVVLAEGETSGHRHFLSGKQVRLFESGELGVRLCQIGGMGAVLRHEEHGELKLPAGTYRVSIKRQYTPEGWESVRD